MATISLLKRRSTRDVTSDTINYKGRSGNLFTFTISKYTCKVKFDISLSKLSKYRDIDKTLNKSDVKVSCTCPDYTYGGFKYIGTIDKYSLTRESRPPTDRNPRLRGTVCKHLTTLLYKLPTFKPMLIYDIMKLNESLLYNLTESTLPNTVKEFLSDFIKYTKKITQKDVDKKKFSARDVSTIARLYNKYYQKETDVDREYDRSGKLITNKVSSKFVYDDYDDQDIATIVNMFKSSKIKTEIESDYELIYDIISSGYKRLDPSLLISGLSFKSGDDELGYTYIYYPLEYKSDDIGGVSLLYNPTINKWVNNGNTISIKDSKVLKSIDTGTANILRTLNTKYK